MANGCDEPERDLGIIWASKPADDRLGKFFQLQHDREVPPKVSQFGCLKCE